MLILGCRSKPNGGRHTHSVSAVGAGGAHVHDAANPPTVAAGYTFRMMGLRTDRGSAGGLLASIVGCGSRRVKVSSAKGFVAEMGWLLLGTTGVTEVQVLAPAAPAEAQPARVDAAGTAADEIKELWEMRPPCPSLKRTVK